LPKFSGKICPEKRDTAGRARRFVEERNERACDDIVCPRRGEERRDLLLLFLVQNRMLYLLFGSMECVTEEGAGRIG